MEMPINYLTPTDKNPTFPPLLISLFRHHFHNRVLVGGTQEEFLAEYRSFRTLYENHTVQDSLNKRRKDEPRPDPQWFQQLKDETSQVLDEFLILVIGMGQISNGFKLVPSAAVTAEAAEEVSNSPPAKGNPNRPASRRYVHVLGNMIQKNTNPQNPGPHGIPEEAKDYVPEPEEMIQAMIDAMKNEVDVLDYHDTKPYQDHWKAMEDLDFYALATTLFKHLNDLHQGIDYVEGFRYIDRYQNLISLLEKCKGTIYFMSRPSTYEDVLLNPHMMKLRFSDNQKNNAKKKIDNKELAERRIREYRELYGRSPPPKERVLRGAAKGKKGKRAASEDSGDNGEDSPQPKRAPQKRRKTNYSKKGKGKAATPGVATPIRSGSSFAHGVVTPSSSSKSFLDTPLLQEKGILPEQHKSWISQQQKQYHQSVPQQFDMGSYFTPHLQGSVFQEQEPQLDGKSGNQEPVTDQFSATASSIASVSEYTGIDNEIATTIYSTLFDKPVARNYADDLNTPFQSLPLAGYQQQQSPDFVGSISNGSYHDNTKSQDDQVSHCQGDENPPMVQQIYQKEPVFQSHSYNNHEYPRKVNVELQPAGQNCRTRQTGPQRVHHQQPYQQQTFQSQIPKCIEEDFVAISPKGWDTDDQTAELNEIVRIEEASKKNGITPEIDSLSHDNFFENVMNGSLNQLVSYTPGELFGGQHNFEQSRLQQVSPLSTASNRHISEFTDISVSDINLESDGLSGINWEGSFLFDSPAGKDGDQFLDQFALPGGQNRMREMDMMLEKDP